MATKTSKKSRLRLVSGCMLVVAVLFYSYGGGDRLYRGVPEKTALSASGSETSASGSKREGLSRSGTWFGAVLKDDAPDWPHLTAKARQLGKPILVMYLATYCSFCKAIKANVFTQKELADLVNEHYIFQTIQVDQTAADRKDVVNWRWDAAMLLKRDGIKEVPYFMIYYPDGTVAAASYGNVDAERLSAWLRSFLKLSKQAPV